MSVTLVERSGKTPQELAAYQAVWDAVCKNADPVIENYAQQVHGVVHPWEDGLPGRIIKWHEGKLQYTLALVAARSPNLLIAGIVSKDDVRKGLRSGVEVPGMNFMAPVLPGMLQEGLTLYKNRLVTAGLVLEGKLNTYRVRRYPIPANGQFTT